jgi:hypothetical protein
VRCSFGSAGNAQTDRCACVRQVNWRDHGLRVAPASSSAEDLGPPAVSERLRPSPDGDFGLQRLTDSEALTMSQAVVHQFRLVDKRRPSGQRAAPFQERATRRRGCPTARQAHSGVLRPGLLPLRPPLHVPLRLPPQLTLVGVNSTLRVIVRLPVISSETTVERLNLRIDRAQPCPANSVFQAQNSTGSRQPNNADF